jgi:hypothetical protein
LNNPAHAFPPEAIFGDLILDPCGIEVPKEPIEKRRISRLESSLFGSETLVRPGDDLIAEASYSIPAKS